MFRIKSKFKLIVSNKQYWELKDLCNKLNITEKEVEKGVIEIFGPILGVKVLNEVNKGYDIDVIVSKLV
jgi:hypothetical protein